MRIMFMGTPDISATCLKTLIGAGEEVVAVVTGKDKPRGRGNVMTPTPTKLVAEENSIPVYTPDTLRDEAFMSVLSEVDPDIIVVVAYGKILPKSVIDYAKYGCVNVHVSLLPRHRGAAPMQRAIIDGDRETGVTIMQMDEGLDTGDIISQVSFPILDTDTFETIHDESAEIGGDLLVRTLADIREGRAVWTKQDSSLATYAAKIEKSDAKIDFTKDSRTVSCQIRGTTPIPGAYCFKDGKMLKLFSVTETNGRGKPGEVIAVDSKGEGSFTVACGEGAILVKGVIPEGKGRMTAGDLIRGRKLAEGDILE
jgi:methionyl-tRNA formyltransferase